MRTMAMSKGRPDFAQIRSGSLFIGIIGPALALTILITGSCGGSLYHVKPLATLPPMPSTVAFVDLGSVSIRAAPLLSDEESQELFESNLQLAGLLPVRIEIIHNSGEAIEMKKVRFRLRDGAGTDWKAISSKQAIARILKANGVSSYNPISRKTFEKEFRAYELSLKTPLTHGEGRREGFIIFLAPRKEPVSSPHDLVLTIEGLSAPATLTLK
jgi:hypothetical protein